MRGIETELGKRNDEFIGGKISFWRQKVQEGRKIILRAQESLEYSIGQMRSWEHYLRTPKTEGRQLLIKLGDGDLLTYQYKLISVPYR